MLKLEKKFVILFASSVILHTTRIECIQQPPSLRFKFVNTTTLQFECSSDKPSTKCNAIFLLNENTVDELRAVEEKCFHSEGICNPSKCECNSSCTRFILILSRSSLQENDLVSCIMRYQHENNENTYKMQASLVYNGTGLFKPKTLDNTNYNLSTTDKPKCVVSDEIMLGVLIIIIVVTAVIVSTLMLITVIKFQMWPCKTLKNTESNHNQKPLLIK